MEDVFGELPPEGQTSPQQGGTQPPEQQAPEPQEQPQQPPPEEPGSAAPPAADAVSQVPFEALERERNERKDWKAKAIKAETERDHWRQQAERQQQPQQQQRPLSEAEIAYNERLNTAEMLLRDKHEDVDEMVGAFMEAANKNPALDAHMRAQLNPWKFAYEEGKRLKFASEIGNDPEAYRKKVRAEIEAELRGAPAAAAAAPQSATPAAPHLPQSLAGARSAGARGTAFTGPVPFESLFPN